MKTCLKARAIFFSLLMIVPIVVYAGVSQVEMLQGRWQTTESLSNGTKLETTFLINSDGSFSGAAAVNTKLFWTYSGTWRLTASKLIWTYLNSSRPLPDTLKTDTDDVISITRSTLVLKSQRSGKTHTFHHAK